MEGRDRVKYAYEKYKIWFWLIIALLLVLIIPVIVTVFVSFDLLHYVDINNPWSGFWGSYLGGIISGVATLYVMTKTIQNSDEALRKTLYAEKIKNKHDRDVAELYELAKKYVKLVEVINKDALVKSDFYYEWYAQLKAPTEELQNLETEIVMLWEEIAVHAELVSQIVETYNFSEKEKSVIDECLVSFKGSADAMRLRFMMNPEKQHGCREKIEAESSILKKPLKQQLNSIIAIINS